jgi:hypothetical protein
MADPILPIVKWSVPLGMATTIIGGSAWLTSNHNATVENTRQLRILQQELKEVKDDTHGLDTRLGRIEEKIDLLVKIMEKRNRVPRHEHRQ